jgi:hypothetical protein
VLVCMKDKVLGSCSGLSTATARWRPSRAPGVARAEEDGRGGKQGRGRARATRGGQPSRRWSGGGSTMTAARFSAPAAESSRGAEGARGRRKEGGVCYMQN